MINLHAILGLTLFLLAPFFCCSLIGFANIFNQDQGGQNVSPDLVPNFGTLVAFLKEVFEKSLC